MSARISIYEKIQTLAIKNQSSFRVCEYGEYIIVTEGQWGVFFRPKGLLIDTNKFKKINFNTLPDYDSLLSEYEEAKKTNECHLYVGDKIAIKVVAKNDNKNTAYISLDFLKQFGDSVILHIKGCRDMVLVTTKSYNPIGFIMPVMI